METNNRNLLKGIESSLKKKGKVILNLGNKQRVTIVRVPEYDYPTLPKNDNIVAFDDHLRVDS